MQFGMWLLRPRVVREFRNPDEDRLRFGPYFESIVAAVQRVHDQPLLRVFWERGELIQNLAADHPYHESLTPDYARAARWYLLDSTANPPRPWKLDTPLAVYALALSLGSPAQRQWLIYAFSPRSVRIKVPVKIPDGPSIELAATRAGCFTRVDSTGRGSPIVGC